MCGPTNGPQCVSCKRFQAAQAPSDAYAIEHIRVTGKPDPGDEKEWLALLAAKLDDGLEPVKGDRVVLAPGISSMNGLAAGRMARVASGPDQDGEYELVDEQGRTLKDRSSNAFKKEHLKRMKNVVLVTGRSEDVDPILAKLSVLRKVAPRRLQLTGLSMRDLVVVSLHLVRKRGYQLWRDANMPTTIQSTPDLMEHIVTQTYTAESIQQGNFHLAYDMLERAIGKRNDRLDKDTEAVLSKEVSMLWLTAADFGVEMTSREEMERRQAEADRQVEQMVGYHKAKQFMAEVRDKVEFVRQGGDRAQLTTCLNLVVTGNPGSSLHIQILIQTQSGCDVQVLERPRSLASCSTSFTPMVCCPRTALWR